MDREGSFIHLALICGCSDVVSTRYVPHPPSVDGQLIRDRISNSYLEERIDSIMSI
jgi:hypothetical protein